jgi:hypothetical protein
MSGIPEPPLTVLEAVAFTRNLGAPERYRLISSAKNPPVKKLSLPDPLSGLGADRRTLIGTGAASTALVAISIADATARTPKVRFMLTSPCESYDV